MILSNHPAFQYLPLRTKEQAAERMYEALANDELQKPGQCRYLDELGQPCIIGSLFTPQQREAIANTPHTQRLPFHCLRTINGESIGKVALQYLGQTTTEQALGITLLAAQKIQTAFDRPADYTTIANTIAEVTGVPVPKELEEKLRAKDLTLY